MNLYRVTFRGDGYEIHDVEAESPEEARDIASTQFPTETRVEGLEFDGTELIEEDL